MNKKQVLPSILATFSKGIILLSLVMTGCKNVSPGINTAEKYYLEHNYTKAYEKLLPLAYDNDPEAQYALGYIYFYGLGVAKDEDLARYWIEASAKQENPYAKESLKMILEDANYIAVGHNQEPTPSLWLMPCTQATG